MLRLLALTLLLAPLAHAQSDRGGIAISLFPCLSDPEYVVMDDPEPFAVWDALAGLRDGTATVCDGQVDDAPSPFVSLSDDGDLLVDGTLTHDGEPLPFGVVVATARDERDGPIRVVAVGVADRDGGVTLALPAARRAIRLTMSPGDGAPPDLRSVRERLDTDRRQTSLYVWPSGDTVDLVGVSGSTERADENIIINRSRLKKKKRKNY